MFYKDKLKELRNSIINFKTKGEMVSMQGTSSNLVSFDNEVDELLEEISSSSLKNMTVNHLGDVVRLIILLDCSGSMKGTETDTFLGLQDLVNHHKDDNILVNLVIFDGETHVLLDDVYIGNAKIPEIYACGSTNLNDSLYITLQAKCSEGINLLVVISDGEEKENRVSTSLVSETMNRLNNEHNHFYFLGEPNERQTPEGVHAIARSLGFNEGNISIFTREGNGNRLNFLVISEMLEQILKYGTVSTEWSKPLKTHYLEYKNKGH